MTKQPSKKELAEEAIAWDAGAVRTEGWKQVPEAIPQAKAATAISIRLPAAMLDVLKAFAEREGVGYQALIKRWLDDRIKEERKKLGKPSQRAFVSLSAEDAAELQEAAERVTRMLSRAGRAAPGSGEAVHLKR